MVCFGGRVTLRDHFAPADFSQASATDGPDIEEGKRRWGRRRHGTGAQRSANLATESMRHSSGGAGSSGILLTIRPMPRSSRSCSRTAHARLRLRDSERWGTAAGDARVVRRAWGVRSPTVFQRRGGLLARNAATRHYTFSPRAEVEGDEQGGSAPGAVGRVVVTTLHNFAMPLIRYDIGDFAEAGEACPCGRGLPVLRRIVGLTRNILVTASGERYFPSISSRTVSEVAPILQYQLVQKRVDLLEARLVTASPLTVEQEGLLRHHILERLPAGLQLTFRYFPEIPRSAGGKFEEFVSKLDGAGGESPA